MAHYQFPAHPLLREFVDLIIIMDINFSIEQTLSPIYTFVPTHTRFLCFYLEEKVKVRKKGEFIVQPESIIIGPQLDSVTLDLGKKHNTVIVALKPCGMYRLLGIPMDEIVNQNFDARLVLGKEIDEILDSLREAKSNDLKNEVIQQYLIAKLPKLKSALPFDSAMLQLVNANGNLSIKSLASMSYVSLRQFERQCLQRIGLPPKLYARMIRFTYSYRLKEIFPAMVWSEIATKCGYVDQAHLIRDFKHFAGFTPGTISTEDLETSVRLQTISDS